MPALGRANVTVREDVGRELAQACGAFHDAVVSRRLRHLGDPILTTAIAGARNKPHGDGARRWSRTSSAFHIGPLVAVTLALHGHGTTQDAVPRPW